MSNYSVEPRQEMDDFFWCVIEHSTEQVIKEFIFEEEARDYAKFLKSGGAFNGFTPSFMLIEVVLTGSINDQFLFEIA